MNNTAAAASLAAIGGLAAYLNAKYHIKQDLRLLRLKRAAGKHYAELGMCLLFFSFVFFSFLPCRFTTFFMVLLID